MAKFKVIHNEAYTYLLEYILKNVLDYKDYELVKL